MLRCDNDECAKHLDTGDEYNEVLVASMVVGAPPPTYAAKFTLCCACTDKMLDSF